MSEFIALNQLERFMDIENLRKSALPQKIIFQDNELSNRYVEYLMDDTNAKGSRREINIQQHVDWLCSDVFTKDKNYFLDIGCGIGQYSKYLVNNGNVGLGIDIIETAIKKAKTLIDYSRCQFECADFLSYDYPTGFDVAIFTYSVFNQLTDGQARGFLKKIYHSLVDDGVFYFEPLIFIPKDSLPSHHWEIANESLFYPEPHLSLLENQWSADGKILTVYKYLLTLTGKVSSYYDNFLLYTIDEYKKILNDCGFSKVSLCNVPYINNEEDRGYWSFVARK